MTIQNFDINRHKTVLTNLLIDIAKRLDGAVVFKGGTAAMMFYGLPRLSLDLDFDLFKAPDPEDIDELDIILRKHGAVKEARNKRFTLFFLLDYEKNCPNIKVEFNKRIWKNNAYKIFRYLGVEIKVADEATIFTNKLVALTDRATPVARDLFDVNYFLKLNYPINWSLVKERTNQESSSYLGFLLEYISKHYNARNVLQGLGEVLDGPQKDWAKDHLLAETVEILHDLKRNLEK